MLGSWNLFKMSSTGCMHLYGGIWCILASRNLLLNPDYAQLLFLVLASRVCLLCQQLTHTCWSGVYLPCSHFWILVLKHVVDFVFLIQVGCANHSRFLVTALLEWFFVSLLFCLLTIIMVYLLSCWLVHFVRFDSLDMFGICCHYNSWAFLRLILLVTVCLFPLCFA